ncbi:MAG: hypothetical protein HOV94_01490 [Saccharothrix sp.]|nr:hypothetical protein [Saccharothrix sp.]
MRWTGALPALAAWAAVAAVVVAMVHAPGTTNAVRVVLTDPPPASPQRTQQTSVTVPATTAHSPTTIAPTTTLPPGTTAQPTAQPPTAQPPTQPPTARPPTTEPTTATPPPTTTDPPACSAPDLGGPITAVFLGPCTGTTVQRYPLVRVSVPRLPDVGGVGIVLHTMTDPYGNESPDFDFRAGIVTEPGVWEESVEVGLLCEDDRSRLELRAYLFAPEGWTYFTDEERPSWHDIDLPPDSRLLDRITVTRTGQPSGPECEQR